MKKLNKFIVILLIPVFILLSFGTSDHIRVFAAGLSSPSNFSAQLIQQYVQLSWKDNSETFSYTVIEKSTNQGAYYPITTLYKGNTSFKDYSITNGYVYNYRARTFYGSTISPYTPELEVIVLYPSSLSIPRALGKQVDLEWSYPALSLLRKPVYTTIIERRKIDSSSWVTISEVPSTEISFRDTDITIDTVYYYRIRTKYDNGSYSYYYPSVYGMSTRTAYPLNSSLSGYSPYDTAVTLEWEMTLSDGATAILQKKDSTGNFYTIFSSNYHSTYTDSYLIKGKTYTYRLMKQSKNGMNSDYTNEVSVTCEGVNSPTDLSISALSTDKVVLSWNYLYNTETGFEVWRKSTDSWELLATAPKNSEAFTDSTCENGETYYYKVRAKRGDTAFSMFSQTKSIINSYPPTPKPLAFYATNDVLFLCSAESAPSNTTYTLEYRQTLNSEWKEYVSKTTNGVLSTYFGFIRSSEYYFRLRANIGDLVSIGPEFHFFGSPPEPVQNVKAQSIASKRVVLSWEDTTRKETGFHIYRTTNGERIWLDFIDKDIETFTDNSPVMGATSRYEVISYNAAGFSSARYVNVSVPKPVTYKDINSYSWASDAIYDLQSLGAFQYTKDGNFYPKKLLTKGEMVSIVLKSFNITTGKKGLFSVSDIRPDHLYYKEIRTAAELGLIHPDEKGRLYPDKTATRRDLMILINNVLGYLGYSLSSIDTELLNKFTDADRIIKDDALIAASFVGDGIITVKTSNYLGLSSSLEKVDCVTIIFKSIKKYIK